MAQSDLQSALDLLDAKIAAVAADPKPNYSIDGESVSHADYFSSLIANRKALLEVLSQESGPIWETTQSRLV